MTILLFILGAVSTVMGSAIYFFNAKRYNLKVYYTGLTHYANVEFLSIFLGLLLSSLAFLPGAQCDGDNVAVAHLPVYQKALFASLLFIAMHLILTFFFGRNKMNDHLISFLVFGFFTAYTFYRCLNHLFLDVTAFTLIFFFKLIYLYYRNSTAIIEYGATSVEEPVTNAKAHRSQLHQELSAFNLRMCLTYVQLAVMQLYFLASVAFNSFKINVHLLFLFSQHNYELASELSFFLLTISLALLTFSLHLSWSESLLEGDASFFGFLVCSLELAPFFYLLAVLFASMSFPGLHVLVGILLLGVAPFISYVLNVRSRFLRLDASSYLAQFTSLVRFLGILVFFGSVMIFILSLSLLKTFEAFVLLNTNDALLYFISPEFLEFLLYCKIFKYIIILILIVGIVLGARSYLAYVRSNILNLKDIDVSVLYLQVCLMVYLLTILYVKYKLATGDALHALVFVKSAALGFPKKSGEPAGVGADEYIVAKAADAIIDRTGTTVPKSVLMDCIDVVGKTGLGVIGSGVCYIGYGRFRARVRKHYILEEQSAKALQIHNNRLNNTDSCFLQVLRANQQHQNVTVKQLQETEVYISEAGYYVKVIRMQKDVRYAQAARGEVKLTWAERWEKFYDGRNAGITRQFKKLHQPVTGKDFKDLLEKNAECTDTQNRDYVIASRGFTGPNGEKIYPHNDAEVVEKFLLESKLAEINVTVTE